MDTALAPREALESTFRVTQSSGFDSLPTQSMAHYSAESSGGIPEYASQNEQNQQTRLLDLDDPLPPCPKIITVNGVDYMNPSQTQTLQQSDGSSFTIGPDFIVYGGQNYSIGSVTSNTMLVSGPSGNVSVAPAPQSSSTVSSGIMNILEDQSRAAENVINELHSVHATAESFFKGQISDAEFGSTLSNSLSAGPVASKFFSNANIVSHLFLETQNSAPRHESVI